MAPPPSLAPVPGWSGFAGGVVCGGGAAGGFEGGVWASAGPAAIAPTIPTTINIFNTFMNKALSV